MLHHQIKNHHQIQYLTYENTHVSVYYINTRSVHEPFLRSFFPFFLLDFCCYVAYFCHIKNDTIYILAHFPSTSTRSSYSNSAHIIYFSSILCLSRIAPIRFTIMEYVCSAKRMPKREAYSLPVLIKLDNAAIPSYECFEICTPGGGHPLPPAPSN